MPTHSYAATREAAMAAFAKSWRRRAVATVAGDRVGCFQSQVVGIGPGRLHLPGREHAGLSQFQGLQGIRRGEPGRWLGIRGLHL